MNRIFILSSLHMLTKRHNICVLRWVFISNVIDNGSFFLFYFDLSLFLSRPNFLYEDRFFTVTWFVSVGSVAGGILVEAIGEDVDRFDGDICRMFIFEDCIQKKRKNRVLFKNSEINLALRQTHNVGDG